MRFLVSLFGVPLLLSAAVQAQPTPTRTPTLLHGAAIAKGCVTPKKTCTSNQECPDSSSCTGFGICSTAPGETITECTIRVTNTDDFGDTIRVLSATDAVKPGALDETIISGLPIAAVSGTTTCVVGGSLPCDIAPGASVSFLSNQYVIQSGDPNPLPDQGRAQYQDLCNVGGGGCSTGVSTLQASGSTDLISGCGPGPTCTPTVTNTPNTPTNTPTNTQTNTPVEGPPPPDVPTLSFPLMVLLGLMLAGTGLFLARRP